MTERGAPTLLRLVGFPATGSSLCQDAAGRGLVGWVVAGPGSGLSEESVVGCEPVALESESLPGCPPGPVDAGWVSRWRTD